MADEFFDTKTEEQSTEQPVPIKLGDKEYTQEELQELVGLGSQAKELESRWDTKIDRLMPEYSRSREELKTLKEQAETKAQTIIDEKKDQGQELSPEEQRRLIKEELKKYDVMTRDDFEVEYANRKAGDKLLEKTEAVISKAVAEEMPKTNVEELLTYMAETGIKDPNNAYELMFKKELREIEMKKLQSIRPQGIYTNSSSTAGAKTPAPVSITKDNLGQLLDDVLTRGGGQ